MNRSPVCNGLPHYEPVESTHMN